MIVQLTTDQLRKLADQVEAYTQIMNAGGRITNLSQQLYVDEKPVAYLHWWEDAREFLCEFLDFAPGG